MTWVVGKYDDGDEAGPRTWVQVQVPVAIEPMAVRLAEFFNAMLKKLDKNSYKQTPSHDDIPHIVDLMQKEVDEFMVQFDEDVMSDNSLKELADISNFSFLLYMALVSRYGYNGGPA